MKRISGHQKYSIVLFLFFGILLNSCTPSSVKSVDYTIKGIDISHHNTVLDWSKVKQDNISFVYLKATEGVDHVDGNFAVHYKGARNAALPIGAYHFYTFGVSGKKQAHHFIQTANIRAGDMIPAIDVEHSSTNPDSKDGEYIKKVIRELKILESELYENYGAHPMIYTNKHCYEKYIRDAFPKNPIWIVDLDNDPSSEINWKIWQFSHTGSVLGMKGNVDLNYYRLSIKEFSELFLPY